MTELLSAFLIIANFRGRSHMNGYILESRSILESAIWKKPPLYFKVWHYLLMKAQHADYKSLKRGQLFTSIDQIRESCSYYVGYRKVTPTRKEVFGVLEWLRNPCEGNNEGNNESPMIVTTKVTHGMVVSIVNYAVYQDPKSYEGNNEGTPKVTTKVQRRYTQGNNNNKNVKNDKKEKNENNIDSSGNPTRYLVIATLFHTHCASLPKVKTMSEQRKARIRNLLKTYTVDDFETVFRKADASDFLSGRSGKWSGCSFDWLTKPSNFLKVLEGNYDNKKSNSLDALKAWAEGGLDGQETDSDIIDAASIFVS